MCLKGVSVYVCVGGGWFGKLWIIVGFSSFSASKLEEEEEWKTRLGGGSGW